MISLPHLHSPWWLLALALLPLLIWQQRKRTHRALTYTRLPAAAGGTWRLHFPFYCRLAALALLIVALSRPQLGFGWEESLTEGIDIQIALDVSTSMAAEDFKPENRLTVAKQVVRDFIAGRPADRLGITVFSGAALTRTPLTTDRAMLDEMVASVGFEDLPDGTAVGMALASAAARLERSDAKTQIIVLVTDGTNNTGEIDPYSAAALCAGLGIKVYTVGVGKEDVATVRAGRQGRGRNSGVRIRAEVDEELLQRIAERTGGKFYRATDGKAMAAIFQEIDRLERTPLQIKRSVRYQETFMPLAWAALGLTLLPLGMALGGWTVEP